jgi:hypothetical protein
MCHSADQWLPDENPTQKQIYFSTYHKTGTEKSLSPFQMMSLHQQEAPPTNKFPFPVHFLTKT